MIPLNRGLKNRQNRLIEAKPPLSIDQYVNQYFSGFQYRLLYSSRHGLHAIYKYLYERKGSLRVAVSPLTCFDAIYPIIQNNHIPVFVDIDPKTLNLNEALLDSLDDVDAIQPIHLGGNPQRMDIITKWANERNAIIIEDCAQALGSFYNTQHVGTFGQFAVFSLVKNVFSTLGGLTLWKDNLTFEEYRNMPLSLLAYKKTKQFLENSCTSNKINAFNWLYKNLLLLKERKGGYNTNFFAPTNGIKKEASIKIGYLSSYNESRIDFFKQIVNSINNELGFQEEPELGVSNRNRFFLMSKHIPAKEVIRKMRSLGIAANNLTQSYINEYQPPVWEENFLNKYSDKKTLRVYESIHNQIFAVPNSSSLCVEEKLFIINTINNL